MDRANHRDALRAVVALKSPDTAKSRLRGVLCGADRRALYFFMARRVISALRATRGIDTVSVVTACDEVDSFARRMGADVIRESREEGTAVAFTRAVAAMSNHAVRSAGVLLIAGDLPLISPEALSSLVYGYASTTGIRIVPDRRHRGTNALLCSPPDAIPPCFGVDSFRKHLAAAAARGISVRVVESGPLSVDIDAVGDLALLRRLYDLAPHVALSDLLATISAGHRSASSKEFA